jgi:hypothetical protein
VHGALSVGNEISKRKWQYDVKFGCKNAEFTEFIECSREESRAVG